MLSVLITYQIRITKEAWRKLLEVMDMFITLTEVMIS